MWGYGFDFKFIYTWFFSTGYILTFYPKLILNNWATRPGQGQLFVTLQLVRFLILPAFLISSSQIILDLTESELSSHYFHFLPRRKKLHFMPQRMKLDKTGVSAAVKKHLDGRNLRSQQNIFSTFRLTIQFICWVNVGWLNSGSWYY